MSGVSVFQEFEHFESCLMGLGYNGPLNRKIMNDSGTRIDLHHACATSPAGLVPTNMAWTDKEMFEPDLNRDSI